MKGKFLIVEDDAVAKLTLQSFLQNFGYEKAYTADNALDAYEIVKKNHIDLILMDIFIRGKMNGIELAHEINKITDVPIIYTTASTDSKTFEQAKETDPYAFITKPYDDRLLKNTIEMALNKHKTNRYHKIERNFETKQFNDSVLDHLDVGVVVINTMGLVVYINEKAAQIFGYSKEETLNFHFTKFYDDNFIKNAENIFNDFFKKEQNYLQLEVPVKHKNGKIFKVDIRSRLMEQEDGSKYKVTTFEDCTERVNLEQMINEKENLIREVHHRVKNNLQVVSGLLHLQADKVKDDKDIFAMFNESINRINAMSMIHEKLYRNKDFKQINMKDYLTHLVKNVVNTYKDDHSINLKMELQDLTLGIDQSILCGLVINEIVSNSCKHAFKESSNSMCQIVLKMFNGGDYLKFLISDNGKGMNIDDAKNSETLGMQLIFNLAEQMDAKLDVKSEIDKGTEYFIQIKTH